MSDPGLDELPEGVTLERVQAVVTAVELTTPHTDDPHIAGMRVAAACLIWLVKLEGIVLDLQDRDFPLTDLEGDGRCALCRALVPDDTDEWDKTGWHVPSCVWRRSRDLRKGQG